MPPLISVESDPVVLNLKLENVREKNLSAGQLLQIANMKGSDNPLYLKIVLNELRVFGFFDTLLEQLRSDYGDSPEEAFEKLINRVSSEEKTLHEAGGKNINHHHVI